jgi:D-xylose ABC transporter substrate-binding protein
MKTIVLYLKMALLILFMASCTNKPKIGFLMDTLELERWNKDKKFFEQKVNDLGGIPVVMIAEGNSIKQTSQAEELLLEGVDVLVVIPVDLYSSRDIVKQAHEQGVPVISYDRLIRDCDLDYYVSTDNINIGELQADYLSKIAPVGKYGLIGGATNDNNAFLLHLGWMNVLQPLIEREDIEIVLDRYAASWDEDQGYNIVKEFFADGEKDIDAVIAGNDALATGAIRALREQNLQKKILVAGQDADVGAIRNIVAGFQTITILKPIDALAYAAASAAMSLAKGETLTSTNLTVNNGFKLVPSILLSAQVVNRQNIKMTVVSEGFVSEAEIYE